MIEHPHSPKTLWTSRLGKLPDLEIHVTIISTFDEFSVVTYQKLLNVVLLLLLSCFSHVWLWRPHRRSPPGSPIPGILQARTLEWVAISFSNAWKWKVKVKSLSLVRLCVTPWTAAYQAPPSMGFSRQGGIRTPNYNWSQVWRWSCVNFFLTSQLAKFPSL